MSGVIVVDAESFRSTSLGHDTYMHDHFLGYRLDYLLFYQLPNSNLFTHRMLFSREKPVAKTMAPGSIFYHILKQKKNLAAIFFYLFYFVFLSDLFIKSHTILSISIPRRE